jgi:hypothetical protein
MRDLRGNVVRGLRRCSSIFDHIRSDGIEGKLLVLRAADRDRIGRGVSCPIIGGKPTALNESRNCGTERRLIDLSVNPNKDM